MSEVLSSRQVALAALCEIEKGRQANSALVDALNRVDDELSSRDKNFVTELVQGTTRMRRALDHLWAPFVKRELDVEVKVAVRLGVYQLVFLGTPPHAALNATVDIVPRRAKGLVNAVLRRISETKPNFPTGAVKNSYPDWIWDWAEKEWGLDGQAALVAMNSAERPEKRPDGYIQGNASRWVCGEVDAASPDGGLLLDVCAAPGGKTTGLGNQWEIVVGADHSAVRASVLAELQQRLNPPMRAVQADAGFPPFRSQCADAVLVDAPCTGLGALGRRSDARWHIEKAAVERLAEQQLRILNASCQLLKPGGILTYSVCTFTKKETIGVSEAFASQNTNMKPVALDGHRWRHLGTGGIVLPQDYGTDGMAVFQWRLA